MALANLDTNVFMRQNRRSAGLFALVFITNCVFNAMGPWANDQDAPYQAFWLAALPFLYLLLPCRFSQILSMESKSLPRFTELFHYSLVLFLVYSIVLWRVLGLAALLLLLALFQRHIKSTSTSISKKFAR